MQTIRYPGAPITAATGINDNGKVVGFYNAGYPNGYVNGQEVDHGFVWKNGRFIENIDVAGAISTKPSDIDNTTRGTCLDPTWVETTTGTDSSSRGTGP